MRMGTFLLGGLVGAAAVVYFSRNNNTNTMMLDNLSQMMGRTRNTMMNFASSVKNRPDSSSQKQADWSSSNKTMEQNETETTQATH